MRKEFIETMNNSIGGDVLMREIIEYDAEGIVCHNSDFPD